MKATALNARSHELWGGLILLAALALTACAYLPGVGGSLHFDDGPNLEGLTQVTDLRSAFQFIAQGTAGPSGRPLALASFAVQAYAWSHAPDVFLYVNICLHLLNGVLVVWMLHVLCIARGCEARQAAWISSTSGAIWMLLPILASSSLFIVQRMTTLSAMFVLLGFIGYIYSRSMLEKRPGLALLLMSICLVLGTGLATLAKENGALLPLFILIAEGTLLAQPARADARSSLRAWCSIFLAVPAVMLFAYLALRLGYAESTVLMRGFSASDRVLTEAHVLWEYLYRAFLPITSELGPFHDAHPVYRNWLHPLSLLAVVGWIGFLGAAVAFRRRAPLFSFGVGWFFLGHALESTTIPLELYFEHRNYIPLIGPAFALVASALALPRLQLIARSGLLAYTLLLALVLSSTTSLWGRPALAGELWAIHNPESMRATQYLARQLLNAGDDQAARRVLRRYLEQDTGNPSVALQILTLSCPLEPERPHQQLLETVKANLRAPRFVRGVPDTLRILYRMAEDERCEAVNTQTVYDLAAIAAANPAFQAVPIAVHNLHVIMSEKAHARRDLDLTMHHIEEALSAHHTIPTLTLAVRTLNSAGLYTKADAFLERAAEHQPRHPIRAIAWRQQLARLERAHQSKVGGQPTNTGRKL